MSMRETATPDRETKEYYLDLIHKVQWLEPKSFGSYFPKAQILPQVRRGCAKPLRDQVLALLNF
jgi:hypothetical protein